MAYNFRTFVGSTSDGLSITNGLTNVHDVEHLLISQIGGGLSSTCEESKGFALKSKLSGSLGEFTGENRRTTCD